MTRFTPLKLENTITYNSLEDYLEDLSIDATHMKWSIEWTLGEMSKCYALDEIKHTLGIVRRTFNFVKSDITDYLQKIVVYDHMLQHVINTIHERGVFHPTYWHLKEYHENI